MIKTYDAFKRVLEQFKKQYKGVWTIFVQKDPDATVGDITVDFDKYYYLTLRRPTLFEFNQFIKFLGNEDIVSATELILNSCSLDGNDEIKTDDTYFLPLVFNTSFMADLEKSMGVRQVYFNKQTLDCWIAKEEIDESLLTQDYCEKNLDKFDYFKFTKVGRNNLRDSSVLSNVMSQQQMLYNLCIEGDKELINNDEILYSLYYSKLLNFLFSVNTKYLKKN